jgi:diaminopimelate decarboxylase
MPDEPLPDEPPVSAPPLSLDALARIGLPAYVYDLAVVRHNHARLRSSLPARSRLFYSLKANSHPALLAQLRALDTDPEVCSRGELQAALDVGWSADRVLYSGPGKSADEIRVALRHGVRLFSVDSPHAMDQLDGLAAALGTDVQCILRINEEHPARGQGLTMTGVASQFGADAAWVTAEPARFRSRGRVRVVGLHLYKGSNLADPDDLSEQFAGSLRAAREIGEVLGAPRLLNLGGGFGAPFAQPGRVPSLTGLHDRLEQSLDAQAPGWRAQDPLIAFESGRYLVGTAGTLFTTVADTKVSHGRRIVVLESGINHLGGMSGLRRLPPLVPDLARPDDYSGSDPAELEETLVAGPLCTPLDVWARAAPLPGLQPGDIVRVPNVGAYGLSASLVAFLGHPAPLEVVVDSERPRTAPDISRINLVREPVPPGAGRKETCDG